MSSINCVLLNNSLVASDNTPFRFGVNENGEYGYIVTDSEGADSVIPFKNIMCEITTLNITSHGQHKVPLKKTPMFIIITQPVNGNNWITSPKYFVGSISNKALLSNGSLRTLGASDCLIKSISESELVLNIYSNVELGYFIFSIFYD